MRAELVVSLRIDKIAAGARSKLRRGSTELERSLTAYGIPIRAFDRYWSAIPDSEDRVVDTCCAKAVVLSVLAQASIANLIVPVGGRLIVPNGPVILIL